MTRLRSLPGSLLCGLAGAVFALVGQSLVGLEDRPGEGCAIRASSLVLVDSRGLDVGWLKCDSEGNPEFTLCDSRGGSRMRLGFDLSEPSESPSVRARGDDYYDAESERSGTLAASFALFDATGCRRVEIGQQPGKYGLRVWDVFNTERFFSGVLWADGRPAVELRDRRGNLSAHLLDSLGRGLLRLCSKSPDTVRNITAVEEEDYTQRGK